MNPYLLAVLGLAVGAIAVYLWHQRCSAAWNAERAEWSEERGRRETERAGFEAERRIASERLQDAESEVSRQREDFQKTVANLQMTFKGISSEVLKENREEFLKQAEPKLSAYVTPLKETLDRYQKLVSDIEVKREQAYGGLAGMLDMLKQGQQALTRETGSLVSALKSPVARGRWGELTLRRVVELAGMSAHCDFEEQVTAQSGDNRLRPDMVVRLPGGHSVVVDAKAPLDGYMKAFEAVTEKDRASHIAEHARAVRDHMKRLSQKSYWEQFESTTDLVIMFLPGESFAAAALEMDRTLFEDGMKSSVVLATPATLLALLRSFAMGWQQEKLAVNSQKISEAGKELYERFFVFSRHLAGVGKGLEGSIAAYNKAVGSWEARVVPGARTLKELGAAKSPDAELSSVDPLQSLPRTITSADTETPSLPE